MRMRTNAARRVAGSIRSHEIGMQLALIAWIAIVTMLHWTVPGPGRLGLTIFAGVVGGVAAMLLGAFAGLGATAGSLDAPGCFLIPFAPACLFAGGWFGAPWALARGWEPPAARLAGMGIAFGALLAATLLLVVGRVVMERLRGGGAAPPAAQP